MGATSRSQPGNVTGVTLAAAERISSVFFSMIEEGEHLGAQLAVRLDGQPIIELAGGRDPRGRQIGPDTTFIWDSTTKLLNALVMHMLHDDGHYQYDDPVALHWPAFAQNGKASITIRHVLAHRAGLMSAGWWNTWPMWLSVDGQRTLMEDAATDWEPGAANGYHGFSIGMIANVLARSWTGQDVGQLLQSRVCEPLGIKDLHIGRVPDDAYERMSPYDYQGLDSISDEPQREFQRFLLEKLESGEWTFPEGTDNIWAFLRVRSIVDASVPFGAGLGTAAAFARAADVFTHAGTLDGLTFFGKQTLTELATPSNAPGEIDRVLQAPFRWGLGVYLGSSMGPDGEYVLGTERPDAIVHGGVGGSTVWADPTCGLTVAFVPNGTRTARSSATRVHRLADVIYQLVEQ